MDHDQRFKEMIREFFADFLRLFFAKWAERFDLDAVVWLDKEVLPNPPEGSRHLLDMVAQLRTRQQVLAADAEVTGEWLALVHIEIEAPDRTTNIKPHLPSYYVHLRDKHSLPVLPLVIYLKVGLDGIGVDTYEERFWELTPLRFQYLYVGLPGLDAVEYVEGDNMLGVALAALMKIPKDRVVELGAEAYRRLSEAPLSEQQRFLLLDCLEAYLPFDEEQRQEFDKLKQETPNPQVHAMNKTTYDRGIEKGREEGIEGMQSALLELGMERFGQSPEGIESRIRSVNEIGRLKKMLPYVLKAQSWEDLLKKV